MKVIVHSESLNDPVWGLVCSFEFSVKSYLIQDMFFAVTQKYFIYLLSQTYLPPMGLATQKGRKLRAQQRLRKQAKPVYLQSHDETWHTQTVQKCSEASGNIINPCLFMLFLAKMTALWNRSQWSYSHCQCKAWWILYQGYFTQKFYRLLALMFFQTYTRFFLEWEKIVWKSVVVLSTKYHERFGTTWGWIHFQVNYPFNVSCFVWC